LQPFYRSPALVSLVVGEHDSSAASTVRQTHDVDSIFVHEDYNGNTFENDVSVIKTVNAIAIDINVGPICAPDPANDYVYRKSQCSGWGTVNSGNCNSNSYGLIMESLCCLTNQNRLGNVEVQ